MKKSGAVAAGHHLTAEAAEEILLDGGNAFDAVTAGIMVACVVEPVLVSLGGGGFLMARPTGQEVRLIDYFVDSPRSNLMPENLEFAGVDADFGTTVQEFHIGKGSTATPGTIPGLFHINEHLGSFPMSRLIEPAVLHAKGHAVTDFQARLAQVVKPILLATDKSRSIFAPEGELLKEGETFKVPELAETFEALAEDGIGLAIDGPLARGMLEGQAESGFLTIEDLRNYEVRNRHPLKVEFERSLLALNPEPSIGGSLIFNMLSRIKKDFSISGMAQAIRGTNRLWELSPKNISALTGSVPDGDSEANLVVQNGTTHISVIDSDGNVAAATLTNGSGNGEIVDGFGFMMNNMLGEKDVIHSEFHKWQPGERLSSMMSPTIARKEDGSLVSLGSGGSSRIRTAIFQVLIRTLIGGGNLRDAIQASRIHIENDYINIESGFTAEEQESLKKLFPDDHQVWDEMSMYFGGVHGVGLDTNGNFDGAGDFRRGGVFLKAG